MTTPMSEAAPEPCDYSGIGKHAWSTTPHGHDICVACKRTRPTAPQDAPSDDAGLIARLRVWLIERGQQEGQVPTIWWCLPGQGDYKYGRRWSEDANNAHRFTSFSAAVRPYDAGGLVTDADAPVDGDGNLYLAHATEHVWLGPQARDLVQRLIDRADTGDTAYPTSEVPPLLREAATRQSALLAENTRLRNWIDYAEQAAGRWNRRAEAAESRLALAESVVYAAHVAIDELLECEQQDRYGGDVEAKSSRHNRAWAKLKAWNERRGG